METPKQSLSDLATIVSNLSKTTHSFVAEIRSSIQNLEIQVGQLSKRILEIPLNTLLSNTEVNPKEECKALMVEVVTEPKEEPAVEEFKEIRAHEETDNVTLHAPFLRKEPKEYSSSENDEEKLRANSSHTEALLEEDEPVVLAKECSVLVQKKLPLKLLDPRSFLIPYTIGTITFEKELYDLGSSINLMPLSVMRRLGIPEVQSAKISLEMVDKTLKKAYGMVEDVLVKVEDLYIVVDFVILDTGEDINDSIILVRPFLAIAKAIIDVKRGELVLRLHEDCILFKMYNPQSPSDRAGDTLIEKDKPITKIRMESAREPAQGPQQEPVQPPPPEIPEIPQGMYFPPRDYWDQLNTSIWELSSNMEQLRVEHIEHATTLQEMRKDQRRVMEEQLRQERDIEELKRSIGFSRGSSSRRH
ncbi:uncharacterized protein LOC130979841 [Arachis stenosperma]|uniref:uncharacterized protein LOC130979841 n=1 Tax=Arachis stenosperma TaxID=217475 RepID=UPI0025AC1664|nr:uncharacterized protein LOC130979841 [Arachis stenosperma]